MQGLQRYRRTNSSCNDDYVMSAIYIVWICVVLLFSLLPEKTYRLHLTAIAITSLLLLKKNNSVTNRVEAANRAQIQVHKLHKCYFKSTSIGMSLM